MSSVGYWKGKKRPEISGDKSPTKRKDVRRKIGDANRKYIMEPEFLLSYYWGAGFSAVKIAKMIGCTPANVCYCMKRYGIPRRGNSECHIGIPLDESGHKDDCQCFICRTKRGENAGENNPSWLGGISFEPYGLEFNDNLKKRIRKRDDNTCKECGIHQDELGYKLNVHHIDYDKHNNSEDNLISLCNSCHAQTNFGRDDWTKYFKDMCYTKAYNYIYKKI